MKAYRFRMTTLLKLREAARDERRLQLAEAQQALEILQERIQEKDDELVAMRQEFARAGGAGRVNVDGLLAIQRYDSILRVERQALLEQRERVKAEAERRRELLVAADREVRVLEKLRENQADRHRQAVERLDQKQMDEVAQIRDFARRDA